MTSITLIALPPRGYGSGTRAPSPALAHIAPMLEKDGIEVVSLDMNIDYYEEFGDEGYERLQTWGESKGELEKEIEEPFMEWVKKYITKIDTEWVGLSIFSVYSEVIAPPVLKHIRSIFDGKIVAGGYGVVYPYGMKLKEEGLVDYFIRGEGEESLNALLKGEDHPAIDSQIPHQVLDLDSLPIPDYSSFKHDDEPRDYTITASRGCVRQCTFCNVPSLFQKFRWKSGEKVAQEYIDIIKKNNVERVLFSDSLVNGNMKEFRSFIRVMSDWYDKNPRQEVVPWAGQFICRNRNALTEEDFKYIKKSGCFNLQIGIESGSESVRDHMKKKFSNDDMYYTLEHLADLGIELVLLMIVGYPTETKEDFEDTLLFFENMNDLHGHKTKIYVNINVMKIFYHTEVNRMHDLYIWEDKKRTEFISTHKEGHDFEERKERFYEAYELVELLPNLRQTAANPEKYKMLKKHDLVV